MTDVMVKKKMAVKNDADDRWRWLMVITDDAGKNSDDGDG